MGILIIHVFNTYTQGLTQCKYLLVSCGIKTVFMDSTSVYWAEPLTSIFLDIVKQQYEIVKKDNSNYLYYTFWFIILKADKTVVDSADFKGIPNEKGEVEIGYGLGKEFERNGYMSEAVKAMCEWALSQK